MNKKRMQFILIIIMSTILSVIVLIEYASVFLSSIKPAETSMLPVGFINLSKNDILLSFEIDDITFSSNQEPFLENALYLAREYNITFDLGVTARQFEQMKDDETFQLYNNNKNSFEVVAHGLTHSPDPAILSQYGYGNYGEFDIVPDLNKSVPAYIQEEHIKEMKDIFLKNNLIMATKIFTVPYHKGDFNTINISEAYGYKLIFEQLSASKNYSTRVYGNITASEDYIDIPSVSSFSDKNFANYTVELNKAIILGQKRIVIAMHPINFDDFDNINYFIGKIVKNNGPGIKFGMVSNTIEN
ncbi:MAG TPA: hypothetical protein VMC80_00795 [Patescibacteria group bacterium]|nr:hypothetical protein [Patescibacteria group bacterium]